MFKTWLPIPPSVNALYSTNFRTKRRFKSKAYEKWESLAGQGFKAPPAPIQGRIHAVYSFAFKKENRQDIENYAKAPSDFLITQKVIGDDSQIDHLELIRLSGGTIPGVFITLREIS